MCVLMNKGIDSYLGGGGGSSSDLRGVGMILVVTLKHLPHKAL